MAKQTYEQALARLEEIVAALQKGGQTLDEAVRLFEEGAALSAFCSETLSAAEQKITLLSGQGEPKPEGEAEG